MNLNKDYLILYYAQFHILRIIKNYICNMKGLIFLLICLFSCSILAQNTENIVVNDKRIDTLTSTLINISKLKKGIDGYRVQIHHNQSENRAKSQKFLAQFSADFPNLKTYFEFKSPYYKIQVGNFVDKLDAYKVQKEISKKYKGTYIVPTIIPFDEVSK